MSKRRPSYAKRALRAEARRFLKLMRKEIVQLVVLATVVCAVEVALPTPAWVTGLCVGFFLTACIATVGFAFLLNGDAAYLIAGALGEAHTEEELETARKSGVIWSYVSNVEASSRDVDHVVLTPSGVLALETKWRFKGADAAWLASAAAKAETGARQARLVLQSKGIDYRTEVRPVVVVWGGARREIDDAQVVAGVDVVRGDHLLSWLQQCSVGPLAEDHAEDLHAKIATFAARVGART